MGESDGWRSPTVLNRIRLFEFDTFVTVNAPALFLASLVSSTCVQHGCNGYNDLGPKPFDFGSFP